MTVPVNKLWKAEEVNALRFEKLPVKVGQVWTSNSGRGGTRPWRVRSIRRVERRGETEWEVGLVADDAAYSKPRKMAATLLLNTWRRIG